jgi:hypothetical protein
MDRIRENSKTQERIEKIYLSKHDEVTRQSCLSTESMLMEPTLPLEDCHLNRKSGHWKKVQKNEKIQLLIYGMVMVRTRWLTEDAMMDTICVLGQAQSTKKTVACKESETNEKRAVSAIHSVLVLVLESVLL